MYIIRLYCYYFVSISLSIFLPLYVTKLYFLPNFSVSTLFSFHFLAVFRNLCPSPIFTFVQYLALLYLPVLSYCSLIFISVFISQLLFLLFLALWINWPTYLPTHPFLYLHILSTTTISSYLSTSLHISLSTYMSTNLIIYLLIHTCVSINLCKCIVFSKWSAKSYTLYVTQPPPPDLWRHRLWFLASF